MVAREQPELELQVLLRRSGVRSRGGARGGEARALLLSRVTSLSAGFVQNSSE